MEQNPAFTWQSQAGLILCLTSLGLLSSMLQGSLCVYVAGIGGKTGPATERFSICSRSIPRGATSFDIHGTSGVRVYIIYNHDFVKEPMSETRWPLDVDIEITITMDFPSETVNDNKVSRLLSKETALKKVTLSLKTLFKIKIKGCVHSSSCTITDCFVSG